MLMDPVRSLELLRIAVGSSRGMHASYLAALSPLIMIDYYSLLFSCASLQLKTSRALHMSFGVSFELCPY